LYSWLACGCAKKEKDGYLILSYDKPTGKWVILQTATYDGVRVKKRLTVVCAFYQWGDHEAVDGPQACALNVGQLLVPNETLAKDTRAEFLAVWELSPDRLAIVQGDGEDKVSQQFVILKEEVVNE
jgi:hypothetical protein